LGAWAVGNRHYSPLYAQTTYRRIPLQYIASLAPADATSGTGAETWGLWRVDPGPIGVWLRFYQLLQKAGNIAPSGWRFDIDDWWLDENGLIMKSPEFPMLSGQYYVTNGQEHISLLTVENQTQTGHKHGHCQMQKPLQMLPTGPAARRVIRPKVPLVPAPRLTLTAGVFH
jgi:hypothetical protein